MSHLKPSLLLLSFLILTLRSNPLFQNCFAMEMSLEARWEQEKTQKIPSPLLNDELMRTLKDRQALFVPGILNEAFLPTPGYREYAYSIPGYYKLGEWIPGYFRSNMKALMDEFQIKSSYVYMQSNNSIEANAEKLNKAILELYKKNGKPVLLFAHSKGGAEALYTILKYPNLVLGGYVDKVVLIQAAIGGSHLTGNTNLEAPLHRRLLYWLSLQVLGDGVRSLEPKRAETTFQQVFETFERVLSKEERDFISNQIFYARSYEKKKNLGFGVQFVLQGCVNEFLDCETPCAECLKSESHAYHDGLLKIEHQKFGTFGIDLGILKADHLDLTGDGYISNTSQKDKEAFTRALIKSIFLINESRRENSA
jgi:pimeloyl-ACP methyl ester carboxylesterase